MKGKKWVGFTLLLLLFAATPVVAEVEVAVRYGHARQVVAGAITPLAVRLTCREDAPLEVAMVTSPGSRMGAGEVCRTTDTLSPGGTKEFVFHYRPYSRTRPEITINFGRAVFVTTGTTRTEEPVRKITVEPPPRPAQAGSESQSVYSMLAVGTGAAQLPIRPGGIRILPEEEKDLPDLWQSYDGIDAVLLRNPGEETALDPRRVRALLRYVEMGGRLIISTRRPDRIRETALWRALPADISKAPTDQTTRTDLALSFRPPTPQDRGPKADPISLFRLTPRPNSRVIATHEDPALPVIVEGDWGYGTVCVTAFDTSRFADLQKPSAFSYFTVLLTGRKPPDDPEEAVDVLFPGAGVMFDGSDANDPIGSILQLLRAGALKPPPMGLLFLFMVLYILAVGPIDYLVLKRFNLLKWSALSFLGLAVIFSVAAWFVSFHLFSGGDRMNRVTYVDVLPDPDDGPDHLLIQDLAGYYAPRGARLTLTPKAETAHISQLVPLDDYDGSGGLRRDPVELTSTGSASVAASLSIPFRSMRTTRTVLYREATFPVEVEKTEDGYIVRNGLPYDLRDALVFEGNRYWTLGNIAPEKEAFARGNKFTTRFDNLSSLLQEKTAEPSDHELDGIGPRLASLSWGEIAKRQYDEEWTRHFRPLVKAGFDRSPHLARNRALLVAWTLARNPFDLPGETGSGFSITIIRKVISE